MVFTQTGSGLVLAHSGSDEAAARSALREYDSDLRLIPPGLFVSGERESYSRGYRVYRYMGSERPIQFVCLWGNEYGEPYEQLSATGLLEMVKRLDRNTRYEHVDADEKNRKMLERRRKEADEGFQEIVDEFKDKIDGKKSSPLPRSRSLYLARNRVRAQTKSNELKP